jgi:hypothetical protein
VYARVVLSHTCVQRFGKGTWIDTDGARYDGKWVKGRKEGSGVMTYANGSKYSGNWQRDRRHGKVLDTTPAQGFNSSLCRRYKGHDRR